MQEFIVWYKNKDTGRVFSREFNLNQLILQNHLDEICDSSGCVDYDILSILPSVEIVDTKRNKMYAESSIFKFTEVFDWHIGYFEYCPDTRAYEVKFYDSYHNRFYDEPYTGNIDWEKIEIIDTIQENKLGLINE